MADSKVMIGGSSLSVKGGKAMIQGSTYNIKEGKTLINGTTNSIKFDMSFINGQSIANVMEYAIGHSIVGVVGTSPVMQSGGFTFPGVNNAFTYDSASGSQSFKLGEKDIVSGSGTLTHTYMPYIHLGYIDFTNYKTLSITVKTSYKFVVYITTIPPPASTGDNAYSMAAAFAQSETINPNNFLAISTSSVFTTKTLDLTNITGSYYLVITGNVDSNNANAYIKSLSLS